VSKGKLRFLVKLWIAFDAGAVAFFRKMPLTPDGAPAAVFISGSWLIESDIDGLPAVVA